MAEPLLGTGPLTGEYDPDARTFELRARLAGPAGAAPLELGGGVRLDLDVAEPSVVVALAFDAPDRGDPRRLRGRTRRVLDALVGPARVADLLDLVEAGGKPVLLGGGLDLEVRRRPGAGRWLQVRALALDTAATDDAGELARAVATLEAAAAGARLRGVPGLRRRSRADALDGAARLLAVAPDRIVVDHDDAARLARLLDRIRGGLADEPRLAAGLLSLADDLRAGRHQRPRARPAAAAAPAAAAGMPAAAPRRRARAEPDQLFAALELPEPALAAVLPVSRWAAPPELAGTPIEAVPRAPSDVAVTLRSAAPLAAGLFARALDAGTGVAVATAPFRAGAGDAHALLLVPHGRRVVVDVTADPGTRLPSAARQAALTAVGLGRAAARAARVQSPAATGRWLACSGSWERAGDPTRAALARAFSAGGRPYRDPAVREPALLADRLTGLD